MTNRLPKKFTLLRRLLLLPLWAGMVAMAVCYLNAYRGFVVDDFRFEQEICKAAKKYDLDPLLVRALIYEESRFDPAKVGGAGEIGLMQIMPSLAAEDWAKAHKRSRPIRERLFSVELNLEIGCWYLGRAFKKWKKYRHGIELALAEYNAGAKNSNRWKPDTPDGEVVKRIDFPGTRNYVQVIMKNYRKYCAESKSLSR